MRERVEKIKFYYISNLLFLFVDMLKTKLLLSLEVSKDYYFQNL